MLNVFLGGVILVAAGIISLTFQFEGEGILLLAGAMVIGYSAVVALSAGGKEAQKRWFS